MTTAEALAQLAEPTVTVAVACALLGIGVGTGYQAIAAGTFPCPVVRVGQRRVVVPSRPLRDLLALDPGAPA